MISEEFKKEVRLELKDLLKRVIKIGLKKYEFDEEKLNIFVDLISFLDDEKITRTIDSSNLAKISFDTYIMYSMSEESKEKGRKLLVKLLS